MKSTRTAAVGAVFEERYVNRCSQPTETEPPTPRISLLHATYRRTGGPLPVRDAWLAGARDPDSIEYIVSMDDDDLATIALTEGISRLVNPAIGEVTAVRNWNAAAAAAQGDLLIVVADDLFPPHGWDQLLLEAIGALDPRRTSFAVKISDSPKPGDVLLRHPVVSRAFYARFGLFSSSYRGLYCDDDFTAKAFWRSVILDGRSLQLDHRHPRLTDCAVRSESHDRLNRREEGERGRALYRKDWSHRRRTAPRRLAPASSTSLNHWRLLLLQRRLRVAANVQYTLRLPGAAARRLLHLGRASFRVR